MSRNHSWMRALDIQMDTYKWCREDFGMIYNTGVFESLLSSEAEDYTSSADLAGHLLQTLWRADTIYVTSDMLHLLMQAAHDLPAEAEFDYHTLISPFGFAYFEEPIYGTDKHGQQLSVNAIAWENAPVAATPEHTGPLAQAIMVYFFVDPHDEYDSYNAEHRGILRDLGIPVPPLALSHMYPAICGRTIPEPTKQGMEIVTEILKLFVAMQLLAQQKIGEPIRMQPDRATRKRMQRAFPTMGDRLITLITLRRKSVKRDGEEPSTIEWSRRWAVRGHWRRQYYARTKTHDWVYIHEYIKGPEDKPFIPTDRRIFDFRR
jgi:hypothetical protein